MHINGTDSSTQNGTPPTLVRADARNPSTTAAYVQEILDRDGAIIVTNLLTQEQAAQIRRDLKPHFDADVGDQSGFFPKTTKRAIGLLGISPGCVELALNPLFNEVADRLLTSRFEYWIGQEKHIATSKPQISSTVGFQVNPGSRQQGLHRDEVDYHIRSGHEPVLVGCVTATVKTTKENGATIVIPGSHKWKDDRCPYDHEAVAAELEPGDATIFLGSTYHAGGANTTIDQVRETVGIFCTLSIIRNAEAFARLLWKELS
jgi:ectoine hydroxylase-related dioxygenase (phytanoyl-CoA dioxygenase family)